MFFWFSWKLSSPAFFSWKISFKKLSFGSSFLSFQWTKRKTNFFSCFLKKFKIEFFFLFIIKQQTEKIGFFLFLNQKKKIHFFLLLLVCFIKCSASLFKSYLFFRENFSIFSVCLSVSMFACTKEKFILNLQFSSASLKFYYFLSGNISGKDCEKISRWWMQWKCRWHTHTHTRIWIFEKIPSFLVLPLVWHWWHNVNIITFEIL